MKDLVFNINNSISNKTWVKTSYNKSEAVKISEKYNIPFVIASVLSSRVDNIEEVDTFFKPTLRMLLPDPSKFFDMDKAVKRIISAILDNEKIGILGDYDVDGITSSAIFKKFFDFLDVNSIFYIPDRVKEGYGPNIDVLTDFKNKGVTLLLTVDCGSSSFFVLDEASKMGFDIIVVDHHPVEKKLSPILALVNPNRKDEKLEYQYLAAVGVSFLVVIALNRALREYGWYKSRKEPCLLQFLDLVALGTVCDVVPLVKLNRAFVFQGLKFINKGSNIGINVLKEKRKLFDDINEYHLAFILGPLINSAGRIGQANLGVELLITDNKSKAERIVAQLDSLNKHRKKIERRILKEANQQALNQNKPIIMASNSDWHPGVIGIVAGRLAETFQKPACVICVDNNISKGSGRSIEGFNMGAIITKALKNEILISGGGHFMAGGFSIEKEKIPVFHDFLCKQVNKEKKELILNIDATVSLDVVDLNFARKIQKMAPFGNCNHLPKFAFANLNIEKSYIVGEYHIRCSFRHLNGKRIDGIAFRASETKLGQILLSGQEKRVHVVGVININLWNGIEKVQLIIEDLALSSDEKI